MIMTDGEIMCAFREAKDKSKQVKILSEINCCSVDKIISILQNNGVTVNYRPRTRKRKVCA